MTIENQDGAGVPSEIDTPEQQQNPEVAAPEDGEQPQQEQKEDPIKALEQRLEKERQKFERRLNRKHAEAAQANERARFLEDQLQRHVQPQQDEPEAIKPEDIERIANQRAHELHELESVSKRSHEIKTELVREVGAGAFDSVLSVVIEEAGPLADERGKWTVLGEAIAESDKPAQLLKYLADNPDEAAALNGLSAARLGRKLAAIEAELAKPKVSKAPQPLKPVTPKGAPHGKSESEMSDAEWYRARFKR